jgi:hypothetical protein
MTPTHDTAAALWSAIDAYGCDAASHGALGKDATTRAAIDRAIAAHVAAEVARALEAAPEVEAAIVDYAHAVQSDFDAHDERNALRAAIAADKARAVEAAEDAAFIRGRDAVRHNPDGWGLIARPTPDEARRLLDEYDRASRHSYVTGGPEHLRAARTALLRALGVEA